MEFEQYLERDIITFLDSKIEKKDSTNVDREEEYGIYLMRDYLKELSYALDNDELTKAKKLFDELKQNYSRIPKSSLQRKKMYTLLEKMYEKIQNYVKIKEGKIEIIRQGDSEIQKDTTETFPDLANMAEKNKFDASKATISEPSNRKILSIEPDAAESEIPMDGIHKDYEKNISGIDSQILGSTIKESKSKGGKYYEDKTEPSEENEDEKSANQNVFVRRKPDIDEARVEKEKFLTDKHKKDHKDMDQISDADRIASRHPEAGKRKHDIMGFEDLKDNIIDKTVAHLEILKMHVTERLLDELSKKLDESNHEQNKRIEELRKEVMKKMTYELDKRFNSEKYTVSNKVEKLRGEILDEVYRQAPHMVTSKDHSLNSNDVIVEHYHIESSTTDIPSIERSDIITYVEDNPSGKSESSAGKGQASGIKYSGDELRVVYEQAIYYMFDNKYNEAAKLFRKIINVQPTNKAAKIRLQECIEKQPELSDKHTMAEDSAIKSITGSIENPESPEDMNNININKDIHDANANVLDEDINNFKDDMSEHIDSLAKDFGETKKSGTYSAHSAYDLKHKYNDEEVQKMYEEAVYTMFQSNYDDAAKMFQQILRIRPANKAARIRLQECIGAISNA